jgi:hypothetical protein
MNLKLGITTVLVFGIWNIPGLFDFVFSPFRFFLDFSETPQDPGHEWRFRSKLDHLIWIFGMFCAYFFPNFEKFLHSIDLISHSLRRNLFRSFIILSTLVVGWIWYLKVGR